MKLLLRIIDAVFGLAIAIDRLTDKRPKQTPKKK